MLRKLIKELRLMANLTQEDVCKNVDVSVANYSGYENKKKALSNTSLVKLEELLSENFEVFVAKDKIMIIKREN